MSSLCWEGVWDGVPLSTAAFRSRISCSIPERVVCWGLGLASGGAPMAPGRLSACSRSDGCPGAPGNAWGTQVTRLTEVLRCATARGQLHAQPGQSPEPGSW